MRPGTKELMTTVSVGRHAAGPDIQPSSTDSRQNLSSARSSVACSDERMSASSAPLHLLEYRGNAWDVFPASANRLGSAKYLLV